MSEFPGDEVIFTASMLQATPANIEGADSGRLLRHSVRFFFHYYLENELQWDKKGKGNGASRERRQIECTKMSLTAQNGAWGVSTQTLTTDEIEKTVTGNCTPFLKQKVNFHSNKIGISPLLRMCVAIGSLTKHRVWSVIVHSTLLLQIILEGSEK